MRLYWNYVLLFLCVLVIYFNGYSAGFIGDDYAVIVNNAGNFDSLDKISSYFTKGVWDHTNVGIQDHNLYRPAWLLWIFSIYQIAGEQTLAWHISNLVLHAVNGILLFNLAGIFFPASRQISRFIVTLLFLIYPAASHDVINITSSTDMLLAVFFLVTLIAYSNYGRGRGIQWFLISLAGFTGALLTKETGVCLLLLLVLVDYARDTSRLKSRWKEYAVFLMLAIIYLLIRKTVLQDITGAGEKWQMDLEGAGRLFEYGTTYMRTLFLPWPLTTTLRHPPHGVSGILDPYLGLLIALLLIYLFIRVRETRPIIGMILLPMSIPLLLALHKHGLFAVRFLYIPVAGMSLLLLPVMDRTVRTRLWSPVIVLIMGCLGTLTIAETYHWKDEAAWGSHLVSFDPDNSTAWLIQTKYYRKNGMTDKAISIHRLAMEKVGDQKERVLIAESLAQMLAEDGRYEESMAVYMEVTKLVGFEHLGWTGVGNNLWMLKRLPEASAAYKSALELQPEYFDALYNYGLVNANMDNLDVAISAYRELVNTPIPADKNNELQQARYFLHLWEQKNIRQNRQQAGSK